LVTVNVTNQQVRARQGESEMGADRMPPRTLLEKIVHEGDYTIDEWCGLFDSKAKDLKEKTSLSVRQLQRWMAGQVDDARPSSKRVAAALWGYPFPTLLGPPVVGVCVNAGSSALEDSPAGRAPERRRREDAFAFAGDHERRKLDFTEGQASLDQLRLLRERVDEAVGDNAMSDASLDDWEQTAVRLGAATRYRSSRPLLDELATDFFELQRRLARRQPLSTLRRLTVVTAQMAGLMSLTLLKLNQNAESRHWARTARVAADEAGEVTVSSWVRAQEAYAHYYGGSLGAAIHVARQAQAVASGRQCVGVALAAALEARAQAALGHADETRRALGRAWEALAHLDAGSITRSAFGYDEAQLRFHEGNAFTHLYDTDAAWQAQQRALELYPHSDYMDRTLIWLDRASCLAHDGDVSTAMTYATQALVKLTDQQRRGLITLRGQQVVDDLPTKQRALPAAREFRDVLMLSNQEGAERPC
jgi:tetratricopeptide (TPR) repeat protein